MAATIYAQNLYMSSQIMNNSSANTTVLISFTYLDNEVVKILKSFTFFNPVNHLEEERAEDKRNYDRSLDAEKYFLISKNKKTIILIDKGNIYSIGSHENIQIDDHGNIFAEF